IERVGHRAASVERERVWRSRAQRATTPRATVEASVPRAWIDGGSEMTDADDLRQRAIAVLDANRLEGWTKAAPQLYPHQWSWDSAFVAVGLARIDPDRAMEEMRSLFRAQWRNGMIP